MVNWNDYYSARLTFFRQVLRRQQMNVIWMFDRFSCLNKSTNSLRRILIFIRLIEDYCREMFKRKEKTFFRFIRPCWRRSGICKVRTCIYKHFSAATDEQYNRRVTFVFSDLFAKASKTKENVLNKTRRFFFWLRSTHVVDETSR